jgi:hypothetical protein
MPNNAAAAAAAAASYSLFFPFLFSSLLSSEEKKGRYWRIEAMLAGWRRQHTPSAVTVFLFFGFNR